VQEELPFPAPRFSTPETLGPAIDVVTLWQRLDAARQQAHPDTFLLCASHRLTQHWLLQDAQRQQALGRSAWLTAPVKSLDRFLQDLYAGACASVAASGRTLPRLLTPAQEASLWRTAVEEETRDSPLLRGAEAARLAAEAWQLAQDWKLSLPLASGATDIEQFNRWARSFQRRCARLEALDLAALPATMENLCRQAALELPATLVIAGLDEITPALGSLLAAIAKHGVAILRLQAPSRAGRTCRVVAPDAERELRTAANWARRILETNPAAHVGIVVPDLGRRRIALQRVFDEVLCPGAQQPDVVEPQRPYNISLGEPLSDQPMIRTALRLLALQGGALELNEMTALLLAPHWGGSEAEQVTRARVDLRLRRDGHLKSDLGVLSGAATRLATPDFAERIRALADLRDARTRRSPAQWAGRFTQWLAAASWPGPRSLNSTEYQLFGQWNELLAEFGALGRVLPALPLSAALQQLRELGERRLFQPQTPMVPIQVLGLLETGGLAFDHLWVVGLDDERWPPAACPNPLIPFQLQRDRGLPHASAARELEFALRLTQRLRAAADEVVLSHAAHEDDRELQASPLILDIAAVEWPPASALPQRWQALFDAQRFELVDDSMGGAPPVAELRGGTRLFGDQAACPFRAYAIHRLAASTPAEPGYGPSPLDRGILTHSILEVLWRQFGSQAGLLALGDEQRLRMVEEVVSREVENLARKAPQRLSPAMQGLERQRLVELVGSWLTLERERAPFRVFELEGKSMAAAAGEQPQRAEVGGVSVQIRPDRVDALDDGGFLIIDYKTGKPKGTPWGEDRPEEPQLLIYALHQRDAAGIAFAKLRAGELGMRGVGERAGIAKGIKPYDQDPALRQLAAWTAVLAGWQREISGLADEIRSGFAAVLPKSSQVCKRCGLQALCRVREVMGEAAAEAAADNGAEEKW
jgi:probable DNA repair protein